MVSVDIGERLVRRAIARAGSRGIVADAAKLAFGDESFDVVISSEMIEHAEAPARVIGELGRVLRSGGLLVLTTPNLAWQWPVRIASRLRLRPFPGLENFVAWGALERACEAAGLGRRLHRSFREHSR